MPLAMEDAKTFCRVIAQWRLLRGLSQQQLGEMISHSQRHISFIENGKTRPSRKTLERLISALAIPVQDGNRLLNLLGYIDNLDGGIAIPEHDRAFIDSVQVGWLKGMHPQAAGIVDTSHRLIKINLPLAIWLNRVADLDDLYDDGRLSWPSFMFHPDGFRSYLANWEHVAAAYVQVVNREILRNPEVGERLMNRIRHFDDIPQQWRTLNDDYYGSEGLPMCIQTSFGPLEFRFVNLHVSTPSVQSGPGFGEFMMATLVPEDETVRAQLEALVAPIKPDDVHEKLRPSLIEY